MNEEKKVIRFLGSTSGRIVLTIGIYVFTLLFMVLLGMISNHLPQNETVELIVSVFSLIVVGIWTVFGWKALSTITPNVFLTMPIVGWVIYFAVKAFLSIFVGICVGPYYISKTISNFIKNRY